MSVSKEMHHWVEKNPLRQYRRAEVLTLMQTASMIGVSTTTIENWEHGSTTPSEENVDSKLRPILGDDVAERWIQWVNERPDPVAISAVTSP